MKKQYLILCMVFFLIAFTFVAQAKSVKWVYQMTIDSTNGFVLQDNELPMLATLDSRGIVYYATYQNTAGAQDIHVYKMTNILDPSRNATIVDTLSKASVWNQYYGLCCDTADNVYMSYWCDSQFGTDTAIRKYDKDGNLVTTFGTGGSVRPPMISGIPFKTHCLCYVPQTNKLLVAGATGALAARVVGFDAATGNAIDTSNGKDAAVSAARGIAYDVANNIIYTTNSGSDLYKWTGGTPSDLTGYTVTGTCSNYLGSYGVRAQLSFDTEFQQTFSSFWDTTTPERWFISVYNQDSGGGEVQRIVADTSMTYPFYGWAGTCVIGSGNNKRLIALDFGPKKIVVFAPELPQIAPAGPITISLGANRDLTVSLGTEPYTWSIATVSGSPGTLSGFSGNMITFLNSGVGSCIVRCTDTNGLYSEITINVIPTSAPLFTEPVQSTLSRIEE